MKLQVYLIIALSVSAIFAITALAQMHQHGQMGQMGHMGEMMTQNPDSSTANYPLNYCIVSGEKLGEMGNPVDYDYHGRQIMFCCSACQATFEKNPKMYLARLDSAIIAKELPTYPLETCVVDGKKLDSENGAPINYVYHNHLVRFDSQTCLEKFKEDPDKCLKKLTD
jgi:YHS domain-containing protein